MNRKDLRPGRIFEAKTGGMQRLVTAVYPDTVFYITVRCRMSCRFKAPIGGHCCTHKFVKWAT